MIVFIRVVLVVVFSGLSLQGYAQLIINPSFEGPPQQDAAPTPWTGCNTYSTPDTQPGIWNVAHTASHGRSFLGLVTRGNLGPYANNNEAVQTRLTAALLAGKSYSLSIDLAFSKAQGHEIGWGGEFLSYANPAVLKVWGGVNSCEKTDLLWESPVIDHTDWKTYEFTIVPQIQQVNFLILEVNYTALPAYFGNMLIDNIVENPVKAFPPEVAGLGPDQIICSDQSVTLDLSHVEMPVRWSDGSTGPVLTVRKTGTYTAEFERNGTVYRDSIQVFFYRKPTVDLGSDRVVCDGMPVQLKATFPGASYQWQNNSTDSTLTVSRSGTYWVDVTTPCGTARDSVVILFDQKPQPVNLGSDRIICDGKPVKLEAAFPGATYRWSDHSTGAAITVGRSGTYWVQVSTPCGTAQDTVTITFEQTPAIELGNDTTLCVGQVLRLNAFHPQAKKYFWQGRQATPVQEVTRGGTYSVEVQNAHCFFRDSITVYFVECEEELLIPNVFTPNSDGVNDQFEIKGILPGKWRLQIYNRYGKEVYYSPAYSNDWDGSQSPAAVYYYLLLDTTSSRRYKGWVQILR